MPATAPTLPLPVEGEEGEHRIVVPVPGRPTTAMQPTVAAVLPTGEAPTRQEQRIPTPTARLAATAGGIARPRHGNDGVPAMPTVTTAVAGFEPTTRAARRRTPMTATVTYSGHLRPPSEDSARPAPAGRPPRYRRPALFAVLALVLFPAHRADGLHDAAEPLDRALPGGQLPTAMAAFAASAGVRSEGALESRRRDERIPSAAVPTPPGFPPRVQRCEQKAHTQISSICGRSRLPWTFH